MSRAHLIVGDCLKVLPTLREGEADSVVTDPPYHLTGATRFGSTRSERGFMNKTWDGGDVAFRPETWDTVARVVRPGGYLLAFGGPRTAHRLTCAIEDAGWEIVDTLMIGFTKTAGGENAGTVGLHRATERGGASRFFYCPKASRAERDAGLDGLDKKPLNWSSGEKNPGAFQSAGTDKSARNHHPTVKPIALMRWLVRLITPDGGTVLDPFVGSGGTGIACGMDDFSVVATDITPEYIDISARRIIHWRRDELFDVEVSA